MVDLQMSDNSSDSSTENLIPEVLHRQARARARSEGEYGIPVRCFCGGRAAITTSFTATNPGRRFYTCERADDGGCHIWKWWDEAMMEEFCDMKEEISDLHDRMKYFTLGDNDEVVDPRLMWRNVEIFRQEICFLKELFNELDVNHNELKAIVATRREGNANDMKLMLGLGIVVSVVAVLVYFFL